MAKPTRMSLFGAAPQEHSPVRNVAEQYRASSRLTRTPPALSTQQPLKTPPTNQDFAINHPSSTGRLRDRRLQSQQQQHSRTVTLQRSGAATNVQNLNERGPQLQFNLATSPSPKSTSAFLSRQNTTPGTERDSNRELAWRAEQQRTATRGRACSDLRIHISGQQANRSSMHSPQQLTGGLAVPDPCMPIEECGERIERLLQRVQQMHREYETRQSLAPPQTPTRLDERRVLSPNMHTDAAHERGRTDSRCSTASSVATEAISDSGAPDTTVKPDNSEAYNTRLDTAATNSDAEARATLGLFGTELAAKTPIERTREKLALLRARRAARLREEEAGSPTSELNMETSDVRAKNMVRTRSEISGTTFYPSDEDDGADGAGFYETRDNLALFREIEMPARDIHWDKRVFYHHVSRTNERFRLATEGVTIADCRDSCLAELTGRRAATQERNNSGTHDALASRRNSRGTPNSRRQQESRDVAALAAWMEEDEDCGSDDADHSFDWSRNGFGYMEFRRRSRSSMASTTSLLSPAPEPSSAPPSPPPACDSLEPLVSPSYASSGHTWSITSSTARVATANFNEAVSAAAAAASPQPDEQFFDASQPGAFGMGARNRAQRGLHMHPGFGEALEGIAEGDEPESDDDWMLLNKEDVVSEPISTVDAEEAARAQLCVLKAENRELDCNVTQARATIQALTRLILRVQ
ncbi:hypothetical protein COEREDRAFT_83298 [Coemansia reversa NRRL 1564]|uniref:Uncharacterized protein n=1 Tax=Coemansia reversa (strain ATCC 12441 / NRRL 1564) TaxID=763665 RepID=A0A2G5B3W3_COERN|nr:hypothetical protein COEREDRAFT_83298 [Coemansia reversa NRRL 1564]|eukprot:PIA13698.1 hypothetical protein COEREDRAFT_83298 [Coemansia reversa NRRL 1564]